MGVAVPDQLFPLTKRFREAAAVINDLEVKRFPLVLTRIIKKLDIKGDAIFSEDEEEQLQALLQLTPSELHTLVEACSFVFERSAYHQLSCEELRAQLEKADIVDDKCQAFQAVWEAEAPEMVRKLNQRPLGAVEELETLDWRLHVQMSRSSLGRLDAPTALLQLGLRDVTKDNGDHVGGPPSSTVQMEFSHQDMLGFLHQLDRIQGQLDNLS
mmetsp:Transcript_36352/g.82924  ORF Transcript_36352/g.82924 Transcript_36352/m.82924 type:complete len:213 (+) Transcript_36352:1-639(+)